MDYGLFRLIDQNVSSLLQLFTKFCSWYEHNLVCSKDCWLFENLDWWRTKGSCSHKAISFSEYFKSTVENCFLNEVKNKILVKLLNCICLTTLEEVEKFAKIKQSNSPDKYVHRYNIELWIFLIQNYNWFTLKLWLKTNLKNCYVSWKSSDSISLKV